VVYIALDRFSRRKHRETVLTMQPAP